ncbi:MAG: hypothetical protein KAJ19_04355 [Gammaproteobacteria bacterium]|nr:hypothetical protein [Gammaproteobacteria bacterium]
MRIIMLLVIGLCASPSLYAKPPEGKGHYPRVENHFPVQLPSGLKKKVSRGGSLPPGWQKKLKKGSVLDEALYEYAEPVSSSIRAKIPIGNKDSIDIRLDTKVIRLKAGSHEIEAIFDIEL